METSIQQKLLKESFLQDQIAKLMLERRFLLFSRCNNKEVKVYLTRAAITAISWDPQMKAYYKRKIAEGKHKAAVINAVRAKIIARSFAVIRRQTPFVTLAV